MRRASFCQEPTLDGGKSEVDGPRLCLDREARTTAGVIAPPPVANNLTRAALKTKPAHALLQLGGFNPFIAD